MNPKVILTMSARAEGCSLEDAMQDIHHAMRGFGQAIARPDRDLVVTFVPDLQLPVTPMDLDDFDQAFERGIELLSISKEQALATGDDERAIVAAIELMQQQRATVRAISKETIERHHARSSEPQTHVVNLG